MKKNKLYTVSKFNRFMFEPNMNLFLAGGPKLDALAANYFSDGQHSDQYQDFVIGKGLNQTDAYLQTKNAFGLSKADNPFSKANLGNMFSMDTIGSTLKSAAPGLISTGAGIAGGFINKGISDGLSSDVGNAVASAGSTIGTAVGMANPVLGAGINIVTNTLGGLVNRGWGTSTDEKKLAEVNGNTNYLNNFTSNAGSLDEIQGPKAVSTDTNVHRGGWFTSSDANAKNEELRNKLIAAQLKANNEVDNNVHNILGDQILDFNSHYAAFGGPLSFGSGALGLMQQNRYFDTIDKRSESIASKNGLNTAFTGGAKTFADGGNLEAAFLDSFGTDPIGAAVRYNQGLEALAAREEARQIEAAREQEYADMQKRLLSLETQNQGLQALMAAVPSVNTLPEIPLSSSTPSIAASRVSSGNANWDYIENQLRKSGKFNDVQIEGIKHNLQRESGFNPNAVGDNGAAFGLGQWHGSRKPKDMSLEGQTRHLIETLSNFDGKEHWVGKDNYEGFLHARTPEEAHYYIAKGYERPRADIVAKVKRNSDMSLKNINAFGGELGTNGTDFTNGLLYIDEGGSHESNPLDGVPMGLDPEGIPNLVEEGETVYNDYVFSDRMMVPDFILKDLGLPKSKKGISFADASKKLAEESEKRPNDPISQGGLDASLSRLAEIQETERLKKQAEEYTNMAACGGKLNKHAHGGPLGNMFNGKGEKENMLTRFPTRGISGEYIGDWSGAGLSHDNTGITDVINPFYWTDALDRYLGIKGIMDNSNMSYNEASDAYDRRIGNLNMGIAPMVGRGAPRIPNRYAMTRNKQAYQQSRKQARSQMSTQSKPIPVSPSLTGGFDYVAQAQQAGLNNAFRNGWIPGKRTTPTMTTERIVQGPNRGGGRFTERTKQTSRLNQKLPTGKEATSKPGFDGYAGIEEGSLEFNPSAANVFAESMARNYPRIWGAAKAAGITGGALGIGIPTVNYLLDNNTAVPTTTGTASTVSSAVSQPVNTTTTTPTGTPVEYGISGIAPMAAPTLPYTSVNLGLDPVSIQYLINQLPSSSGKETEAAKVPTTPTTSATTADESKSPKTTDSPVDAEKGRGEEGGYSGLQYTPRTYDTWMRYMPAFGSGLMSLSDMMGITNRPDYTYPDKIEASAYAAGNAPKVGHNHIGNYLRYEPRDIFSEQIMADSNARATDRAIGNNSGPLGTKMAGWLASGLNNQIADWQLRRNALDYNSAQREKVADFNRRTDMFNSQMGLEAAMANARYQQAARQMELSGLAQVAALRDAIDARVGAARSGNLNNFLTNLGNIGRENFALNQINWDRSRRHGASANGTSYDKVTGKPRSCGGKMNRK